MSDETPETPRLVVADEARDMVMPPADGRILAIGSAEKRTAPCKARVADRASSSRRCHNRTSNPNGYCWRHQLEARIEETR